MRKQSNKLTMMELIAIITIIVVLITILFPVIVKSREWGKSIKCKGNMKSISGGIFSYASDNKECLPYSVGAWSGASWTFAIQKLGYVPAPKKFVYTWSLNLTSGVYTGYPADYSSVWACPSQNLAPQNSYLSKVVYGDSNYNTNYLNAGFWWHTCHYGMPRCITRTYNTCGRLPLLAKQSRGASSIGLLIESAGGTNGDMYSYYNGSWGATGSGAAGMVGANLVWGRHWGIAYGITSSNYNLTTYLEIGGTKVNSIFVDGHSESWNNMSWWNNYKNRGFAPFNLMAQ